MYKTIKYDALKFLLRYDCKILNDTGSTFFFLGGGGREVGVISSLKMGPFFDYILSVGLGALVMNIYVNWKWKEE